MIVLSKITKYSLVYICIFLTACSLDMTKNGFTTNSSTGQFKLTLSNISTDNTIEVSEGSTLAIVVAQNQTRTEDTNISVSVAGDSDALLRVFPTTTTFNGTIPQGSLSTVISIPLAHDPNITSEPVFEVSLESANSEFSWSTKFNILVKDIDAAAGSRTLTISPVSVKEGSIATFNVTLSAASVQPITVDYATADSAAIAGSDYTSVNGSLTFNPGETTKTISVNTISNAQIICSANKDFSVVLSNAHGATINQATVAGTIVENESPSLDSQKQMLHTTQLPDNKNASGSYELGIRIKANADGKIVALRFLQAQSEGGTHTASLWSSTGTKLADVTFAAESGFKIFEGTLSTPVTVNAGDEFVVSVNSNSNFAFATSGLLIPISNGDLVSVNAGTFDTVPGNFPTTPTTQNLDYFTDVVFIPNKAMACLPDKGQSILVSNQIPEGNASDYTHDIELGVTVFPQTDGYITAIKYYQPANEAVSGHTGKIWSSTGTLLKIVAIPDSSVSGWRTISLDTPLHVTALSGYVISVNSRTVYPYSHHFFAQPYQKGDLLVPMNAGVFNEAGGSFPASIYQNNNYLRDVIFYNDADYQSVFGAP
ncbi:MAG: DUF4082 domain-containing protein [Bdellovibrio sp.]